MDPISTAVIAGVSAKATTQLAEESRRAIAAAFENFKNLLKRKLGEESDVLQAAELVERKPDKEGPRVSLFEEVEYAKADQDPELLEAANLLLDLIRQKGAEDIINRITAAGDRSIAAQSITRSTISTGDKVDTRGGDYQKVYINLPSDYDLKALFEQLLRARKGDAVTLGLLNSLREILSIHQALQEWKDLHHKLNDILIKLGSLTKALQNKDLNSGPGSRSEFVTLWNAVEIKVKPLIRLAASVQFIDEHPYIPEEPMSGPEWARDIRDAHNDVTIQLEEWGEIEQISTKDGDAKTKLLRQAFNIFSDKVSIFNNYIEHYMYTTDDNLRDTAGELAGKSKIVLGSLGDVNI